MDFNKLCYFVCCCELGSSSKAAEKLHITVQGLNKAILSLEEECGAQLIDRRMRGFSLTPSGKYFLGRAREMLEMYESTLNGLKEMNSMQSGKVNIGLAYGIIPALRYTPFLDFQKLYPKIEICISELEDSLLEQELLNGAFELAITVGKPDAGNFDCVFLQSRRHVVICNIDNPLSRQAAVRFEDLQGQRVILLKDTFNKNSHIKDSLAKVRAEISPISGISEMNTIMSLCEDNHGLGICPEGIVNTSNSKTIVEVPFDEDDFEWDIYLTTKKRVQLSYPAKLMKQFLTRVPPQPAPGRPR